MSDNMKKMHKRQEMDGCISSEYVVGELKYHVNMEVKPAY